MTRRRSLRYDVVVIGGGAAGVGAAVGAARSGARALLVERHGFLGGAATNANVLSYCGFFSRGESCRQVVGGVGARVLAALARLGCDVAPVRAPSGNWIVMLDPEALKVALDRVVAEAGVDVRLHATLTQAHASQSAVRAVSLFDHAGELDVEAPAFVDGTGSGDVGFLAGVPNVREPGSTRPRQHASLPLRIGGVAPDVVIDRATLARIATDFATHEGCAHVRDNGGHLLRLPASGEWWWMGVDVTTGGLDSADVARAERDGRDLAWRFFEALRARMPGFERAYVCASGPQLGIRDSRQLATRYRLTDDDVLSGRARDDGVARGCWPAELHGGTRGPTFEPVGGDGHYDIPLTALRAQRVDDLWVGGRAIGCDERAYGSLRVMGTAFATGHACGVAAARLAAGHAVENAAPVRRELLRQGAIL